MKQEEKETFVEAMQKNLQAATAEVEELGAKMEGAADATKEKLSEALDDIKATAVGFENKVKSLGDTTEDKWQLVRSDIDHTWKAFRNSVNYFRSHFK